MKKETYPKLPKDFKKKWIAALRSGEYKQLKNNLYKENWVTSDRQESGYCCLGVAARVCGLDKEFIKDKDWLNEIDEEVINESIPAMLLYDAYTNELIKKLQEMNDGEGRKQRSFKQIANWIEKNL